MAPPVLIDPLSEITDLRLHGQPSYTTPWDTIAALRAALLRPGLTPAVC